MPELVTVKCKKCGRTWEGIDANSLMAKSGLCGRCYGTVTESAKIPKTSIMNPPASRTAKGPPLWALGRSGKMFKKIEKANLPPDAEKVLKEKILKDNISTSVEDMAKNPLKKIGNVAKDGVAKTFGQLEQKYGKKKDLLKDMVDTSGTFLGAGGREPEKKKSSILGNLISKFKSKQSTEGSKGEAKQAAASSEKSENKGNEGEEKPGKITKGKIGLIGASILGMVGGYLPFVQFFPELANSFLVVGGTSIAMITLAMFTKPKHQSVFIPLWLLVSAAGMYVTGSLNPVIPVAQAAANDIKDIGKNLATGWTNLMCFMKTSDPNCWEPPATEDQNVNKIGEYQTLQLSEGRKTTTGTIGNQKPVSGDRYSYDVMLKNVNDKIYEINVTKIEAWAENETFPADHVFTQLSDTNPYVLKPKEELPVTFMWGYKSGTNKLPECPNGIVTFKINISSRQYGGGYSNYGIAPSDEGDWIKFLHYFDPEVTAEPGPLNIYVYTEPYAIDYSYFSSQPFYIIIKITNPKVQDSVATLYQLHLVQTFEAGSQFFNLATGDPDTCMDDLGNAYGLSESGGTGQLKSEACPPGKTGNCYRFELENFDVNFDEGREIVCKATLNVPPTDDITDQIRVYASYYDFKQKFVYPRSCKVETTAPITTTTI
jgi:hypothetical protein